MGCTCGSRSTRAARSRLGEVPTLTLAFEDDELSVDEWLADWVFYPKVRVGELINEVGTKDGAHTDAAGGVTMTALEAAAVYSFNGALKELARPAIAAVGKYVVDVGHRLLARRTGAKL